jgi:hypothetical protein
LEPLFVADEAERLLEEALKKLDVQVRVTRRPECRSPARDPPLV